VYRNLRALMRDPLRVLAEIGTRHEGQLVRLDLGPFRPYLVTRPDHVRHVLRDRSDVYLREGMMWKPIQRLEGNGIAGEGVRWRGSRTLLQPLLTTRAVAGLTGRLAAAVNDAVDGLARRVGAGSTVDVEVEMTRIMHRALCRAFFGDHISPRDADTLGHEIAAAFSSLGPRMLLPFVGSGVPMPGDRRFHRAVRVVDSIVVPRIARARAHEDSGDDLVSLLARTRDESGDLLDERWVRDDVVAMFVAGTDTTSLALTWLWILLDQNPAAARVVAAQARQALAGRPVSETDLPALPYLRMALQETLRLYPVGWIIPRTAAAPDDLDGVPVKAGATVIVSPYLTHRMPSLWERPERFDPLRFAPGQEERRHRYAYYPFGGGPHACLGNHLFLVEAQLAAAALLSRFELRLSTPHPIRPGPSAALRPRGPVEMVLEPLR
jgi:cytochrome P450